VSSIRPKRPRLRLDAEAYQQLCRQVVERDSWRCQSCGSMQQLQVHHKQFRSHSGDDSEENLITLCDQCHKLIHGRGESLREPARELN
jgi:5-methylcytosine-specific restriction endonuclease McrA